MYSVQGFLCPVEEVKVYVQYSVSRMLYSVKGFLCSVGNVLVLW